MNTIYDSSTGKGIRIAIIDSGVFLAHSALKSFKCSSLSRAIYYSQGKAFYDSDIEDEVGHGTAICGIFAKLIPDAIVTVIKVFHNRELWVEPPLLMAALDYILDNVECDIVHMSMGISTSSNELLDRCVRLNKRGTLIVSAYDNAGGVSFPAHYDGVVGVDGDIRLKKENDFYTILGKKVTVLAKGSNHRVAWREPAYIITRGSSFSAGYVTAYAAKMLEFGVKKENIAKQFASISKKTVELPEKKVPLLFDIPFSINHAIIYPYNKEMHSLVNYADKLTFTISGICDSKYTGRIGKHISSLNGRNKFIIKDISDVNWDEADTLILGHLDKLDDAIGIANKSKLLSLCMEHHLNVYSFDENNVTEEIKKQFCERGLCIYVPILKDASFVRTSMRKLFSVSKPVLCVFGTSSQQGKFTLQLDLRYHFMEKGYNVVQLGSEPSSLLYGCDACFPFGHNSTVEVKGEEFISSLNAIMHEIDIRTPNGDLIIAGCQSGTVPATYANLSHIPLSEIQFLISIMADAAILCVNPDDDIDYILRTIKTIEGLGACKVIAVCLYPLTYRNKWFAFNNIREPMKNPIDKKKELSQGTNLPVFIIGDENETEKLCDLCIDYLSE